MSQSSYEAEDHEAETEAEPARGKQPRVNVEIQVAEAQRVAARATVRSARYMLWATIIATISTLISTAGAVYVIATLSRTPH
jgi:hypothetical protein